MEIVPFINYDVTVKHFMCDDVFQRNSRILACDLLIANRIEAGRGSLHEPSAPFRRNPRNELSSDGSSENSQYEY
eukprot:804905-Pleurochrysis_carterae.AAC.1